MIRRFTTLAITRPRRVLAGAGVLFVIAVVLGTPVTGMLGSSAQDFEDPASQYERTNAAIQAATGQNPYYNVAALLQSSRDVRTDTAAQGAVGTLAALLSRQHGFQRVLDYGQAEPIRVAHAALTRRPRNGRARGVRHHDRRDHGDRACPRRPLDSARRTRSWQG